MLNLNFKGHGQWSGYVDKPSLPRDYSKPLSMELMAFYQEQDEQERKRRLIRFNAK